MTELSYTAQQVLSTHVWVPNKLFSIRVSKDPAFMYKPGMYARLGLATQGDTPDLWRAFSMVNPPDRDYLEFYGIVVPDGQFSPRMAQLAVGDTLFVDKTPFGFLTLDQFPNGGDTLWLLATGTGISAFLALLEDSLTWTRFKRVVLCHGVRTRSELSYAAYMADVQAKYASRLTYLPISTRERNGDFPQARITQLIETGQLEELAHKTLDPDQDCMMLCGNPDMLTEARQLLGLFGFKSGRRGQIGNLAVEKYW